MCTLFVRTFSVINDRNGTQASFNTKWAFTGSERSEDWQVKLAFHGSYVRIPSRLAFKMENWLHRGGGTESFNIRKLV